MTQEIKTKENEIETEVVVEEVTSTSKAEATSDSREATIAEIVEEETAANIAAQPEPSSAVQEAPAEPALEEQLAVAQAEVAKNLEGWQRAAADLANYKRRQEEQSKRLIFDITAKIVREILPAIDDLDLAFQNLPETLKEQEANWVEGFKLVQRKLFKILENNNIQPIDTNGQFDPNLHEAVTHEPSPDHASNTIIAELRKGYMIGDRVLRPALVRVAQ